MIRQFTFHKPKEILQPTLWLFLSQACSMLPAILAYMAIYTLGEAFVPPYTLDLFRLITLAALGVGCFVLQYIVELISYYFTYGKAYRLCQCGVHALLLAAIPAGRWGAACDFHCLDLRI